MLYSYSHNVVYAELIEQKSKGKVHPCAGTEALYRPYGAQAE
jgi:hypothetical protein